MKRKIYFIAALAFCSLNLKAQITPEIYSWILNTNGATGYAGIPSNVQQVQYSTNNVYISATCIPGYDIGPWTGNPNIPANQNFVFKITRTPAQNTGTAIATPLGHMGVFTNGVSIFNPKDAMTYMNQNVWQQNAIVVEGPSFDNCLGHPAPNGEYHHHLNPVCLYNDSITNVHSPIIGFAFDGFPVYGAYGYANTDGTGGIKRMQTSYAKRNITTRTTLPDGTTAGSGGPDVSAQYPIGYYVQDYIYTSSSGDLDEHNGRFCVTPDYPTGHYCYFVTIDSNRVAEYPYIIGPTYYGTVPSGNTGPGSGHNTISESVTIYNGPAGINDFESKLNCTIFPNPSPDILNFQLDKNIANNIRLELFSVDGQSVFRLENMQPSITYSINISNLSKGIYFARLNSASKVMTQKIVIE